MKCGNSVLERRLLTIALLAVLAATLVAAVRSQVETVKDRKRIAMRCAELTDRLKRNANDKEALSELVTTIKGNWSFGRVHAAIGLGNAGPNAMPAIQDLIQAMGSDDGTLRREAVVAVGKVSKGSPVGVDPLIKMLDHPSLSPYFTAQALAEIGAPAEKAIEPLRQLAERSTDSTDIRAANSAIEEIQAAVKKANSK
jgi:HEAT repeat protein